ncbi:MAG: Por secretion system C-terminal sorting protein, partial [candidate division NC10 bacterium]|nr:Por secretion system C-terminal sorting protein [candidate division NC10 bacterium]
DFVTKAHCYRAFRFPWNGQATAPYLVVDRHNDRLTLLYNLFGERPVNKYYVYAGTSPHPTTRVDSSTVPRIDLKALANGQTYYIRVTAADSTGWESGYSNEETVPVRYILPGESMVLNGDFSQGKTGWELVKQGGASALGAVTIDGRYFVAIGKPGTETWSIQLRQIPFDLTQGKRYIVAFDASASDARYMDVRLEKSTDPYTNYTRRGLLQLTRETKRFAFSFQMIDPSDGSAQLVFNMGQSDRDVTIDNVDVREAVVSDAGQDPVVPIAFTVHEPFPNPFNPSTTLRFELPEPADVRLTVVNMLGERVASLDLGRTAAGVHDLPFSPGDVASGVYIGRVEAASPATGEVRHATIKLLYLK